MEFTVSKNTLQKELALVQGAVEKKNTLPHLANVLVEAGAGGTVSFTGTDLDVTVRADLDADTITPGTACLKARKLFDIARVLPDAPVNIRSAGAGWAEVTCERSTFRIPGVSADQFPVVPSAVKPAFRLPASLLKAFIQNTLFAVTNEESRYSLAGAKFEIDRDGWRVVTTDGHRLAFVETQAVKATTGADKVDTLVPRKALSETLKLLAALEGGAKSEDSNETVGLAVTDNHIYFDFGSRLLVSRMLTGQFPNYEAVIPKSFAHSATFDAAVLREAVRRVALMAEDHSHGVNFRLTRGQLELSAKAAEEGEGSETLPASYDGDEIEVGFNAAYVQDCLSVVERGEIVFEFKDAMSQTQFRPATTNGHGAWKAIVMPMRL